MIRLFSLALCLCFLVALPATAAELLPEDRTAPADLRNVKAAAIMVYKSERRMDLVDEHGQPIRTYMISLGKSPVGDKEREGDNRTPEGKYIIDARNLNSKFYKSLRISYPNTSDRWRAKKKGVSPGGDIFIHGLPNGKGWMRWKYNKNEDWTNGCIGVYNYEINEIWSLVDDGTPIFIKP